MDKGLGKKSLLLECERDSTTRKSFLKGDDLKRKREDPKGGGEKEGRWGDPEKWSGRKCIFLFLSLCLGLRVQKAIA